ncbi:ZnF_C2H2 [Nesidiocoris tenuis]|uniref:ZnF_C2H2 n=1 Tax=Nesidiocoris tenuis TaxID=355587 RepID=A0ABN7A9L0_9HEMI|nr:ZnF_C2H2 [Nesidiocoris tenuis]
MAADTKQNIKTLRVDNWAIFFLQRLQLMFAKGDACDLTLNFHTGQELKVHRLVLITCTTFFENLAKDGDTVVMPEDLPYTAVQPIINFLYSGKLEFKPELHAQLLTIAKSLDITILAKLLITQKNDNGMGIIMKNEDKKSPQRTFLATRIGPSASKSYITGKKLPIWRQRTFPFFKPPERRIIKEEEPKPRRFDWPDGKEPRDVLVLTTPSFTPLSYESENVFTPVIQPAKALGAAEVQSDSFVKNSPTPAIYTPLKRPSSAHVSTPEKIFKAAKKEPVEGKKDVLNTDVIDFSDDDDDGHFETIHTFGDSDDDQEMDTSVETPESKPDVLLAPAPEPQQESVPSQVTASPRSYSSAAAIHQNVRPVSPPVPVSHDTNLVSTSPPPAPTSISTPPVTPAPSSSQSLYTTPKPILKPINDSTAHTPGKKVRFSLVDEMKEVSTTFGTEECSLEKGDGSSDLQRGDPISAPTPLPPSESTPETASSSNVGEKYAQPPALVQPSSFTVSDTVSNKIALPSVDDADPQPSGSALLKSPAPTTYSATSTPKTIKKVAPAVATNHAKIIAEVLKKYPELVRNNKNIRLKISSPGTTNVTNLLTLDTKKTDGKSSYMVVKSYVKTEGGVKSSGSPYAVTASTSNLQELGSTTDRSWSCSICSTSAGQFDNYLRYRAHMREIHNEKLDPRCCEYCGYRTAKRNLLLYHLFTKHKVDPPQNVTFPKCDLCGYVAMSDTLLQRHVLTHKSLTDWPCPKCKILFKSSQSLRSHLFTCKKDVVVFSCTYCSEKFSSNIQLNDHSRNCAANPSLMAKQAAVPLTPLSPQPQEQSVPQPPAVTQDYEASNTSNRQEQNVEMIEVPLLDTESLGTKEHTFIQLPNGLILVPAQPQQLRRVDGQPLEAVGNEVALIRNGGSALDQMAVNQNITLLSSDGGEAGRNNVAGQMGLAMALPQDQHVILLDANSEFFIQGNDSVVVTRLNDAADEYIVPEVMDESMQELYTAQGLPYTVATSAASVSACSAVPVQSSQTVSDEQTNKQDDCGSTVVRVQNSSELDSVQIRHPDEMGTIIVQDVPQNSMDEQHHLYADEPSHPRPHMSINKELMDVVAMEVQRSPSFLESSVIMPEVPQAHHTVLRQTSSAVPTVKEFSSAPSVHNVYHRMESRKDVSIASDNVAEDEMVIEEDPSSNEGPQVAIRQESEDLQEEIIIKDDYDSEEERMAQRSAAKADSFVKDWGFDNEEESDGVDLAGEETDDENNDGNRRIGPSRVTVEL